MDEYFKTVDKLNKKEKEVLKCIIEKQMDIQNKYDALLSEKTMDEDKIKILKENLKNST